MRAILFVGVTFCACTPPPPGEVLTADSYKFLVCNERTGTLSYLGRSVERGMEHAAQHVNDGGGLAGRRLQLIKADTHSDAQAGLAEASFYYREHRETVLGLVGAVLNETSEQLYRRIANEDALYGVKIPMISPGSTSPTFSELLDVNELFFRTVPVSNNVGRILAARAGERGFKNGAVLAFDDVPGHRLVDTVLTNFPGEIAVAHYKSATFSAIDTALNSVLSKNPQFLVIAAYGEDGKIVLSEWAKRAPGLPLYLTEALMANQFLASLDPRTVGELNVAMVEGVFGSSAYDSAGYLRFISSFCAANPGECHCPLDASGCDLTLEGRLLPSVPNAYDATMILALAFQRVSQQNPAAMERSGGWDIAAISAAILEVTTDDGEGDVVILPGEWQKAAEAIAAGRPINYEGASARTLELDLNGDPTLGEYRFWTIRSGAIVETDADGNERVVEIAL